MNVLITNWLVVPTTLPSLIINVIHQTVGGGEEYERYFFQNCKNTITKIRGHPQNSHSQRERARERKKKKKIKRSGRQLQMFDFMES